MNAPFQQYLEKQNIHFHTAKNEPNSAIIECYNRTLKGKRYRHFTALNILLYVDILHDLVNSYNGTFHQSIGMAPNQVSLLNVGLVRRRLQRNTVKETKKMYKYTTGDYVRLSLTKQLFKKGYLNNFTEEVFVIHECLP